MFVLSNKFSIENLLFPYMQNLECSTSETDAENTTATRVSGGEKRMSFIDRWLYEQN